MKVDFFNLSRQFQDIKEDVNKAVCECLESCAYVEGPKVKELEQKLAEFLGVKHVITCGNGTDSLKLALRACGVKPGDEVITTSFSFFATAEAIAAVGATPIFADIDQKTLNISAESIKSKITSKTKAILPVHIFGLPADMDEINEIAKEHKLKVIEDACQAIGSKYNGKMCGAIGDAGCFSFYPTKNLGCFGDGGMVTTNDDDIANVCRALKAHANGKTGLLAYNYLNQSNLDNSFMEESSATALYDPYKYYNYLIAENSRLDSIQATVLLVKLDKLEEYNKKRNLIADKYIEELKDLPIELPTKENKNIFSCCHQFCILTDKKEDLTSFLKEKQIGTGAFYPVPLHLQKAFTYLGYREGSLETAEDVCKKSLCLPIFPELTKEEQDYIISSIKEFFRG